MRRYKKILYIFIIAIIFVGCETTDGFDKLNNYDWGITIEPILREIGV